MANSFRRIFNANDVAKATLEVIKERREHKRQAVTLGIDDLDNIINPLFPGELITVLANTANYKSGFMNYVARHIAEQIVEDGDEIKEFVAYATWEMSVEELTLYWMAGETEIDARDIWLGKLEESDMPRLEAATTKRAMLPLWVLGDCLSKRSDGSRYTLEDLRQSLQLIEKETAFRPRAIFLDYLQEIDPITPGRARREEVMENVGRAKALAREFQCPVIQAAQANRGPRERAFKLPELGDSEETARIEQASDKLIALWMPKNDYQIGELVPNMPGMRVTDSLLVAGVRKQRMGLAGTILPLYVDPAHNTVGSMDNTVGSMERNFVDIGRRDIY